VQCGQPGPIGLAVWRKPSRCHGQTAVRWATHSTSTSGITIQLAITEGCAGLLMPVQGSASDTSARLPRHLTCDKPPPTPARARTNCRQVQQSASVTYPGVGTVTIPSSTSNYAKQMKQIVAGAEA
jgi:hypothetical protein